MTDYRLLESWLGLPAGCWPPDHYALLDLPPDVADASLIEQRVLERMDRLRAQQLRHPELATVGMNQLAQAFVCLTDSAQRSAYDAALRRGVPAPSVAEAPGLQVGDGNKPVASLASEAGDRPPGMEESRSGRVDRSPAAWPVPAEGVSRFEGSVGVDRPDRPVVEAVAIRPAAHPRWIYRRLAWLRRCQRAWDALNFVLAHPEQMLDRPAQVYRYLLAVQDIQPLIPALRATLEKIDAELTFNLLSEEDPVQAIVRLPVEGRIDVARQWQQGREALEQARQALRGQAERLRPRRGLSRLWGRTRSWLGRQPEWLVLGMVILAVGIACLRRVLAP